MTAYPFSCLPAEFKGKRVLITADLGTAFGVQEVVDRIEREWGGIDIRDRWRHDTNVGLEGLPLISPDHSQE
jgi:hypothetical protein